jgi:hypothetical protein
MADYSDSSIYALLPNDHTIESANGFVYISYTKANPKYRIDNLKSKYRRGEETTDCTMLFDRFGVDNIQFVILYSGSFPNRSRLADKTQEFQYFIPCINKMALYKNQSNNKGNPYYVL